MQTAEMLEGAMLLLFSISWYWSIAEMLRTRVVVGKSATFVSFICCGYVCGIAAKLLGWAEAGTPSPLIYLYAWNLAVTLVDLALVVRLSAPRRAAATA